MLVKGYLRAFVNDRQDNWQELTPLVEFAINNTASPLTPGSVWLVLTFKSATSEVAARNFVA